MQLADRRVVRPPPISKSGMHHVEVDRDDAFKQTILVGRDCVGVFGYSGWAQTTHGVSTDLWLAQTLSSNCTSTAILPSLAHRATRHFGARRDWDGKYQPHEFFGAWWVARPNAEPVPCMGYVSNHRHRGVKVVGKPQRHFSYAEPITPGRPDALLGEFTGVGLTKGEMQNVVSAVEAADGESRGDDWDVECTGDALVDAMQMIHCRSHLVSGDITMVAITKSAISRVMRSNRADFGIGGFASDLVSVRTFSDTREQCAPPCTPFVASKNGVGLWVGESGGTLPSHVRSAMEGEECWCGSRKQFIVCHGRHPLPRAEVSRRES